MLYYTINKRINQFSCVGNMYSGYYFILISAVKKKRFQLCSLHCICKGCLHSLFQAGGAAGLVVDIVLFPIDTVKTRLQSEKGFWRSGGFRGIYNGLAPAAVGSVPSAAIFFCTYESVKSVLLANTRQEYAPLVHMSSASMAETVNGRR